MANLAEGFTAVGLSDGFTPVESGSRTKANEGLLNGPLYNASPEQSAVITANLSTEEMDMNTYVSWLNASTGTNQTQEMAMANLKYEYGDQATPGVANAANLKAAKHEKTGAKEIAETLGQSIASTAGNVARDWTQAAFQYMFGGDLAAYARSPKQQEAVAELAAKDVPITAAEFRPIAIDFSKKIGKAVKNITPEEWQESQAAVRAEAGEGGVNFLKLGLIMVADNAGNLLASAANPVAAFQSMFSNERNGMEEQMIAGGIDPLISNDYSSMYGAVSAPIEFLEMKGRIGAVLSGKVLSKLKAAGINVGQELLQDTVGKVIYNEAVDAHNAKTGDSLEKQEILDIDGNVITGSLAMSTIMEAFGLSVKGTKAVWTLGDANRTRKQNDNKQVDKLVDEMDIPAEQKPLADEMLKIGGEANVEAFNAFEPEVEGVTTPEGEEVTLGEGFNAQQPEGDTKVTEEEKPSQIEREAEQAQDVSEAVPTAAQEMRNQAEALEILGGGDSNAVTVKLIEMYGAEFRRSINEFEAEYGRVPSADDLIYLAGLHTGKNPREVAQRIISELGDPKVTSQEKPSQIEREAALESGETRITVEADNLLREEYGFDKTTDPDTRTHASLIQESIESDRDINILLDDIKSKPRPLEDFESADIAREKARLSKSLRKNKENLAGAIESDNEANIEKYASEKKSLDERLIEFTNLSRLAKTETGRALSALNITLNKKKDLTDHVNDATAEKGGKITDKEFADIEEAYDESQVVEAEIDELVGEDKSIDDKIAETKDNIKEAKRTVKPPKKDGKAKSAKQKELDTLKEMERDTDVIFKLQRQLNDHAAELSNPKIKDDPAGYKAIIESLLEIRSESQWWKDLNKSKNKSDKRRVRMLNDTLDNLQAQYEGKFRDVKQAKEDVSTDEIVDLKNKINYIRGAMRLEDKIAAIDEDIRLIGEGRYDEITPTKRQVWEQTRDSKLDHLHNELANKRRRLSTLKTDIGTGKVIKVLEFQRAMKLSLDSWLLRQGGPSLKSNPFLTLDAWFKSFAGFNEGQFYETQRIMESTQSFNDSKDKMGVVYNDIDAGFVEHQEAINSSLAEKIPPVRGSNRHMVLGVNLLRWNWSRHFLNRYPNESPEFYRAAGKFVNNLTGRGGLGGLESSARGLTAFFTAPRYTTSKWSNIANMRHAWIGEGGKKTFNKDLAKEIAGQKARMYSGYAGMATMLIAMGFEMGIDPEDPLFGKFRKGKVVIDIAPHMTAEVRLIALYMEAFAANSLGIGKLEGNYDADMFGKTLRYAGYKVIPTFGTIMEAAEGKTVVGEERSIVETLALYPLPIMIEGLYQDLIKDQEDMSDIITSQSFQFIGAGGGIYDDTKQKFKRLGK